MAHYLGESRILGPGNANGFIPGEAAAAVLCDRAPGPLRLTGLGLAREVAHIYNRADRDGLDLPLRGDGMTRAYQLAMEQAQVDLAHVEYRIADHIGEQYFFKETTLAGLRLERGRKPFQDQWSPTEILGQYRLGGGSGHAGARAFGRNAPLCARQPGADFGLGR